MSNPIRSISMFFPMYNEKAYVETMVAKAKSVLKDIAPDYEVLVIDDCSRDGSEKIADRLAEEDHHVRVIHHLKNQGYGGALRTGFQNASKDYVFYTDCDEPFDLNILKDHVHNMGDCDVLIGYRVKRHDTVRRFIYSKIYNFLVRNLFGVKVRDVNFSFKICRRQVLEQVKLSARSVFIDGQLLAEAVRYGFKIREVPINYNPRQIGASSFDRLSAATSTFDEIVAYWWSRQKDNFRHIYARLRGADPVTETENRSAKLRSRAK